jgi:hypothetical protein|tara:strand:- start:267 stop:584 length:318 start_codon:yes stop_codon:yes gene_type:complete
MENITKKIYHLDFKNNELLIHYDVLGGSKVKKAKTVKQVVDILNITKGTDYDLNTTSDYEYSLKGNRLWNTGYTVWLYSIQRQANGKPLGFYLAYMKYREIYGVA